MPHIGARIPRSLKTEIERIAHAETVPGKRNVKPSHVIRAALRYYRDDYDDLDELAFEAGASDLEDGGH